MKGDINKLLSKLAVAVRTANERLMCDIGLHAGQAQILIALWEKDNQSQADLVRNLSVSPPTVNKMVKKLVKSGFVKIQRCPEDRRLMRVRLTAKGARIQLKVEGQINELENTIVKDLTETEQLLVPILLEKIHNNILTLILSE